MPTTRARHMITETDAVERAIDSAARMWPELRNDRAELVRRLIELGASTVQKISAEARAERRTAIRETAGMLKGMYPPNAARLLKEEWPE